MNAFATGASPGEAFQQALIVEVVLLAGFFVVAFRFPNELRADTHGISDEERGRVGGVELQARVRN